MILYAKWDSFMTDCQLYFHHITSHHRIYQLLRCRISFYNFLQFLQKANKVWNRSLGQCRSKFRGLQVYRGSSSGKMGLGNRVAMALMEMNQQKNCCLYIDNLYHFHLLDKGIYCTGNVCTNQIGFPTNPTNTIYDLWPWYLPFAAACRNKLTAMWWIGMR